ncbi:type IV pili methyl-accepting chemotaxis transducer N-terminal domain-containing protein [candidate division KSB1 bacterium]|nr:type IV pili methyl-accepting chemotaxis transducer N-terminal domain-containing protein [candidate division KSB1 bacterium]
MEQWESKFIKNMTLRYVFALSVLALIAVVADHVLQDNIQTEQNRGAVINSGGRLRMLSQRIALLSLELTHTQPPESRNRVREELLLAVAHMEVSLNGLIHGDVVLHLPGNPSAELRELYFGAPVSLLAETQKFVAAAQALCRAPENELHTQNLHLQYIQLKASSDFLERLDELVKVYQREGEVGIARLQKLERLVMVITVFVLFLMALLIFRPMVKRIHAHFVERSQAEVEREKLIADLRTALANVKTLSGLIPICSGCKKIRDDHGYWNHLEAYLERHSNADFTHGFCPECQRMFEES